MTPFDPVAFIALIRGHGHNGLLDIGYVAHGEDWVALQLPYDARLAGDPDSGILASGPIVSVMDMAASAAFWMRLGRFRPCATLDLRVDYLRPATPGRPVTTRMECYRVTRRIGFVRGHAHDGDAGDPLAHATGTFMLTDAD